MAKGIKTEDSVIIAVADYVIEHKCTQEAAGKQFGLGNGTVSYLFRTRLPKIDPDRAHSVEKIKECHNIDKGGKKQGNNYENLRENKNNSSFDKLTDDMPHLMGVGMTRPDVTAHKKEKGLHQAAADAFDELIKYLQYLKNKNIAGESLSDKEMNLTIELIYAHTHNLGYGGIRFEAV